MPSRYEKYTTHHTSRRYRKLSVWDYTQPAAYFMTICTQDRICLFGAVEEGRMMLNPVGRIVAEEWKRSEAIRDRVHLDAFVVMPNHLHGIVVFADPDVTAPTCPRGYRLFGAGSASGAGGMDDPSDSKRANDETASHDGATNPSDKPDSMKASTGGSTLGGDDDARPTGPAPRSLGAFIAGFKSAATTRINDHRGTPGAAVWQRNYHDRIIWTERHWRNAREYIRRNPADWGGDRLNRNRDPNT